MCFRIGRKLENVWRSVLHVLLLLLVLVVVAASATTVMVRANLYHAHT